MRQVAAALVTSKTVVSREDTASPAPATIEEPVPAPEPQPRRRWWKALTPSAWKPTHAER
jgi:hypothetical protein